MTCDGTIGVNGQTDAILFVIFLAHNSARSSRVQTIAIFVCGTESVKGHKNVNAFSINGYQLNTKADEDKNHALRIVTLNSSMNQRADKTHRRIA